jgi:hypothetical protein
MFFAGSPRRRFAAMKGRTKVAEIRVTPGDAQSVSDRDRPGDGVALNGGAYGASPRSAARAGRADGPIVLRAEPGAVLNGGRSAKDSR